MSEYSLKFLLEDAGVLMETPAFFYNMASSFNGYGCGGQCFLMRTVLIPLR